MNKKLQQIQNKVDKEYPIEKYEAACELIKHSELAIQFLQSQVGQDLQGSKYADEEILKHKEIIRIKSAERSFLESIINEE